MYKILQALPIQELLLQLPIHFSFKPKGGHPTSHPGLPQFKPPRKKGKCLCCKGPRPAYYNVITNWEMGDGLSLKKKKKMCLNCLESHKSAACQSQYQCHKCRGKHYTVSAQGQHLSHPTTCIASEVLIINRDQVIRKTAPKYHHQPSAPQVHATVHPTPPTSAPLGLHLSTQDSRS